MKQDAGAPLRRKPPRAALILGALGAGAAALAAGGWVFRVPIADFAFRSALAGRGIEADYRIVNLDLSGLALGQVRLGPASAPDIAVERADISFGWAWLGPRLEGVRLVKPRVHATLNPDGALSLGQIDRLTAGPPTGRRPTLPRIRLDIEDGAALLDSPYGVLNISIEAEGALGRDFTALAELAPVSRSGEAFALDQARAVLRLNSANDGALSFELTAGADRAVWNGTGVEGARLAAAGRAALDFSALEASVKAEAGALSGALAGEGARAEARLEASWSGDAAAPRDWRGRAGATAERLAFAGASLAAPRLAAEASGGAESGEGKWSLRAARLEGFGLAAPSPIASGDLALTREDQAWRLASVSRLMLTDAALDADAQDKLRAIIPNLAGAPIGPPLAALEQALDAAADKFNLAAPLRLDWRGDVGALAAAGPIEASAANGVRMSFAPLAADAASVTLALPKPALSGAARATLTGGGAPDAVLRLDRISWGPDADLAAHGALTVQNWRTPDATLLVDALGVRLTQTPAGAGQLDLKGAIAANGPLGDGRVRDMRADLDLAITWDDGWNVTPARGCLPLRLGGVEAAGLVFGEGAFELCAAEGGPLIAADARDQLSGGFTLAGLSLDGRMAGEAAQPARLRTGQIAGRFGGATGDMRLDIGVARPSLAIELERTRTMTVVAQRVTADTRIDRAGWRVDGAFEAGTLDDRSLPGAVSAIAGRWSAAPEQNGVIIGVEAGEALVADQAPPNAPADRRPAFHDLRLRDVRAVLRAGAIDAEGDILLAEGARQLAGFSAHHDIESGRGHADVDASNLTFNPSLQPYELTELARGVVENVRGPLDLDIHATWTPDTIGASGRVHLRGVSLATASMPVIENVRGEVAFDDLIAMTTPPGQAVTVGLINPGVEVRDGRIQFQLLSEGRVVIEDARWPFADGELGVTPTSITLGSEETQLELTLTNVDVAALITQLNLPDLHATGRVEGRFPLRLYERAAIIDNGVLRASSEGGTIAYVGAARQSATGMARLAFDALASFRYDDLSLRLNGDLGGDVVGAIEFSGRSTGDALDAGALSPMPGFNNVSVRGVPFVFNVTVTAPFRRLAEAAARVADPRAVIDQAIGARERAQTPDQGQTIDPDTENPN